MPVNPREREQIELILRNLDGSDVHPAREQWGDRNVDEVDYLYHKRTILAREQDLDRVTRALIRILYPEDSGEVFESGGRQIERPVRVDGTTHAFQFTLPEGALVPTILDSLDRDSEVGPGVARPDHVLYVTPGTCAATEPIVVPGTADPVPPPGLNARGCRPCRGVPRPECDGAGVRLGIVDTGLIEGAADGHPWLAGVQGGTDSVIGDNGNIRYDAGHGTFVAGVARCMAPKVSAYVEKAFEHVGANFETALVGSSLKDALSRNPDILQFTFCTTTRQDLSLLTFDDFFETRVRYMKGLVVLAPAGNNNSDRLNWPAAYREVISVGALSANWRDRAWFSNYGKWVDVYAPGQDLINAFPSGTYECFEPPVGEKRTFRGMAKWSGTSFSTPVVAGMIAARMSATGENARQAADSLLRRACSQTIPGVGAVLYPGQACDDGDDSCGDGRCGGCGSCGCHGHGRRARCGWGGDRPGAY